MIFWVTPELREKLYPYLDLGYLFHLAECHKLTRESLKKALIWNRLIKRAFPEDVQISLRDLAWSPHDNDAHLASEKPKARHLCSHSEPNPRFAGISAKNGPHLSNFSWTLLPIRTKFRNGDLSASTEQSLEFSRLFSRKTHTDEIQECCKPKTLSF